MLTGFGLASGAWLLCTQAQAAIAHAAQAQNSDFRFPTTRSQGFGTTILATGGKGDGIGDPLFFLKTNADLRGLTVFYPEQDATAQVAYPWCVRGQGENVAIVDVLLVNPWNAADFGTFPCGRHFISGLHGQPLNVGLFVDQCLDCGRIENVHFWPFWTSEPLRATRESGMAFRFGRTDWQMIFNVFCLGYQTGFHFTAIRHDAVLEPRRFCGDSCAERGARPSNVHRLPLLPTRRTIHTQRKR